MYGGRASFWGCSVRGMYGGKGGFWKRGPARRVERGRMGADSVGKMGGFDGCVVRFKKIRLEVGRGLVFFCKRGCFFARIFFFRPKNGGFNVLSCRERGLKR